MKSFLLSIFLMLLISTASFSETVIKITNGEWEPYLSQYAYEYGLASHIVSESFKLEGIVVKWGFYPWKRSYELAKKGKWDASAVWWPTKETKQDFLISDPVVSTSFVFFYVKGRQFNWDSFNDLKGLNVGYTIGYGYGKEFMTAVKEKIFKIDKISSDEKNYKKLLHGRTDIFPNDPIVGYAQIRNSFTPEDVKRFTHHPKEFEKNTLNLIISKNCKNGRFFLEKFNSGLEKLKKSGRIDQMVKDLNAGKYDKQKDKWKK
jgi:polar amino acid transport system substrate-binding protein